MTVSCCHSERHLVVIPNVVRNLKSRRQGGAFEEKGSCFKEHLRFLVVRSSE